MAIADSDEIADGLQVAVEWIRKHRCGEHFSVVYWSDATSRPRITFPSIAAMKRAIPGAEATVKKSCSSTDYTAVIDGIEFTASKYGCSESPTSWVETL